MRNLGSYLLPTGFVSLLIWSPSLWPLYLSNKSPSCWMDEVTNYMDWTGYNMQSSLLSPGILGVNNSVLCLLNIFMRQLSLTFPTILNHQPSALHNLLFPSFMRGQGQHNSSAQNFSVSCCSRFMFQRAIDLNLTECLLLFLRRGITFLFWGLVLGSYLDIFSINHVLLITLPQLLLLIFLIL